jgi:hypothetical protein
VSLYSVAVIFIPMDGAGEPEPVSSRKPEAGIKAGVSLNF